MKKVSNQNVSKCQFDEQLSIVQANVKDPLIGLFGPDSMSWEINKYMTTYLGAGRAVLLQLAHPWVANGITQHSNVKEDTQGRLRRTSIHALIMLFGSLDQVLNSAKNVHQVHARIHGKIHSDSEISKKGDSYQANEVKALIWVQATLIETSVKIYELFIKPLSDEEKNKYYQESKLYGHLFGIPKDATPSNWSDFMDYNKWMWDSQLTVGDEALNISEYLLNLNKYSFLRKPWNHYKIMTSLMMPSRLRNEFGLPEDTLDNQKIFKKEVKRIKKIVSFLPRNLKYMPPYNEAMGRILGKKNPDYLIGVLNKLIYKQKKLVS